MDSKNSLIIYFPFHCQLNWASFVLLDCQSYLVRLHKSLLVSSISTLVAYCLFHLKEENNTTNLRFIISSIFFILKIVIKPVFYGCIYFFVDFWMCICCFFLKHWNLIKQKNHNFGTQNGWESPLKGAIWVEQFCVPWRHNFTSNSK